MNYGDRCLMWLLLIATITLIFIAATFFVTGHPVLAIIVILLILQLD